MAPDEAALLRLYLNADDRFEGRPLYEAVVTRARALGLAGASVFEADSGFGAHRIVHDSLSEYSFAASPIVIDVVDASERIRALLHELVVMVGEGPATLSATVPLRVARDARPRERSNAMPGSIEEEGRRVTIYIGSADTWHGTNLAAAIVERCRKLGFAGATAIRGAMGFGETSRIHRAHLFGLSEDLPEKIEIIDTPEKIAELLAVVEEMVSGGLVVVEDVRIIHYRPGPKAPA